jgi:threonine dehydratase
MENKKENEDKKIINDKSYDSVIKRKNEIMKKSLGIDYSKYYISDIAFDYEKMMDDVGYTVPEILNIQRKFKVGNTPIYYLPNITKLVRKYAKKGKGAKIYIKDEAANASGSFKARRASLSVYLAKKLGYKGVIAATSGNYGAAVASQAAMQGLQCIIIQEVFDSKYIGQPEIVEKSRHCDAYGAEVIMSSVGPELFYSLLLTLEETGFFNASLYTPYAIAGVETLGWELIHQMRQIEGRDPDAVIITHAGGGNVTGTARGILKAKIILKETNYTEIIGCSVDLTGLHMASDNDFNKKSFTTGHTGFGVPFATWPDRTDTPRNAARPLRYLDRYITVTQGEVFYATEMLAALEGLERGPAGNTSLAGAINIAMEMDQDQILVIQETEYTGAGKHPQAQLSFARNNGIEIKRGDPRESINGKNIILPRNLSDFYLNELDLKNLKRSYLKNLVKNFYNTTLTDVDIEFISNDINEKPKWIKETIFEILSEIKKEKNIN